MSITSFPGAEFFIPLSATLNTYPLPERFTLNDQPDLLARVAAADLQEYLDSQTDWDHNFGLSGEQNSSVIGKMFGVLVVRTLQGEIGYLAAFSGKLAGRNHHIKFVPPVFDSLSPGGFVNEGMRALTRINRKIKSLEEMSPVAYSEQIGSLKSERRNHSNALQREIFHHYFFLNQAGEKKSLIQIFKKASYKNPPSGAGECAAPKLLQYAFKHNLQPLTLTEFWWGLSPKSEQWQHRQFYPCCREKCHPILEHMLGGLLETKDPFE